MLKNKKVHLGILKSLWNKNLSHGLVRDKKSCFRPLFCYLFYLVSCSVSKSQGTKELINFNVIFFSKSNALNWTYVWYHVNVSESRWLMWFFKSFAFQLLQTYTTAIETYTKQVVPIKGMNMFIFIEFTQIISLYSYLLVHSLNFRL